jgi:hypothetical protein
MYDPIEARKTYRTLLKENGLSSSAKSALFVVTWYLFEQYSMQQAVPIPLIVFFSFVFFLHGSLNSYAKHRVRLL